MRMTPGRRSSKNEWLTQLRAGKLACHDIEERTVSINVQGSSPRLVGQIVADATVYGTRARWQLRPSMDFEFRHGRWTAPRSVVATW